MWKDHCEGHPAFARLKLNDEFKRRLKSVRDDYVLKAERCKHDLVAFQAAKKNHPTPEFNSRGEPQWNGSAAQAILKEMVALGEHAGIDPKDIWSGEAQKQFKEKHAAGQACSHIWINGDLKATFQVYGLDTFRDHIYQEERLRKFNHYVSKLKKKKVDALQY